MHEPAYLVKQTVVCWLALHGQALVLAGFTNIINTEIKQTKPALAELLQDIAYVAKQLEGFNRNFSASQNLLPRRIDRPDFFWFL